MWTEPIIHSLEVERMEMKVLARDFHRCIHLRQRKATIDYNRLPHYLGRRFATHKKNSLSDVFGGGQPSGRRSRNCSLFESFSLGKRCDRVRQNESRTHQVDGDCPWRQFRRVVFKKRFERSFAGPHCGIARCGAVRARRSQSHDSPSGWNHGNEFS